MDPHWTAALVGITNYFERQLDLAAPAWTRRISPLKEAWLPAESYRTVRAPMKQLLGSEAPQEFAATNVFIRVRSLVTA